MPLWEDAPAVPTQTLNLDGGITATAAAQSGDFTYTSSNGEVTITGYTGVGGAVVIPALLDAMPVRVIGASAFSGKNSVTGIAMPSGLTTIGTSAFSNCTGLTSVTIPTSVTSIGGSAFYSCTRLASITIPAGVTSIGSSVFYYCIGLKSVAIPASITSIGTSAFSYCEDLTSVAIPAGVTSIGSSAFSHCAGLTSVTIPAGVLIIGNSAFTECIGLSAITVDPSNAVYASVDGVLYNKSLTSLIQFPGGKVGSVAIPPTVTSIDGSAFSRCTGLSAITVNSSNTAYASVDGVLYNKSLTSLIRCPAGRVASVAIPSTVTSIDNSAFYDCAGLTSVTIPASVTSIGSSAFSYCTGLTSVTIPVGVTSIGDGVFSRCTGLRSVAILASVTSIGASAFLHCTGLTNVAIPAGVTSIGGSAFYYCTGLTSVTIPAGVTSIGTSAFSYCVRLVSITIPVGVTSIGNSAFYNCTDLTSMYFFGSAPSLGSLAFSRSQLTVCHLADANGWSSTYGGAPVEVFQPVDVAAGQKVTVSIGASVDRVVKKGTGTAVLGTPSTRTGGTAVEAGELVVRNKDALGTGLLEVQAGAKATFQTGYDTVSVMSLSLATTSRLELGTGKLTVAANGFTESDIRTKLVAGRNGGSWDGASGITSTFAGGDRAIGYRVADRALEMAFAAPGDSNLDGVIDILDLGDILSAGKFNTGDAANWMQGDTNYDGVFDILDLSEILGTGLFNQGSYLTQGSASSAAADAGSVATFDPALVFAALAAEPTSQPTTKRKSF